MSLFPIVFFLLYAGAGFFLVIDAYQQIHHVARETARVMVEAPTPEAAVLAGLARADQALGRTRLDRGRVMVTVDPGTFARETGLVAATVTYRVNLSSLPFYALPDPVLSATARWPVQRFANR